MADDDTDPLDPLLLGPELKRRIIEVGDIEATPGSNREHFYYEFMNSSAFRKAVEHAYAAGARAGFRHGAVLGAGAIGSLDDLPANLVIDTVRDAPPPSTAPGHS